MIEFKDVTKVYEGTAVSYTHLDVYKRQNMTRIVKLLQAQMSNLQAHGHLKLDVHKDQHHHHLLQIRHHHRHHLVINQAVRKMEPQVIHQIKMEKRLLDQQLAKKFCRKLAVKHLSLR